MRTNQTKTTIFSELKLLSRGQVAGLLGVSVMTIKRYQQRGALKAIYLSPRAIRYHSQDVQNLIQMAS
jgi:predicted site-specific integrase-resolvase